MTVPRWLPVATRFDAANLLLGVNARAAEECERFAARAARSVAFAAIRRRTVPLKTVPLKVVQF